MAATAIGQKRYTAHLTTPSGPHVWDQDLEQAALFSTLREADDAAKMLNAGFDRDMWSWAE